MKNVIFSIVLIVLVASACNKVSVPEKAKLSNEMDSVSYALGVQYGGWLKDREMSEINYNAFLAGSHHAFSKEDKDLQISQNDANEVIMTYLTALQAKQNEAASAAEKEFFTENAAKEGVESTGSGLQYKVVKEGEGSKPAASDRVKVHYHGTFIDGSIFDSSVERGEPATFGLNQVIPGWTEGLQLMSPGAKYIFYIPSELAYGERGRAPKIKPFTPLIFEVELFEINPKE